MVAQQEAGWDVLAVTRLGYPVQVGKFLAQRQRRGGWRPVPASAPVAAGADHGRTSAATGRGIAAGWRWNSRPSVLHTTTHFVNGMVVRAVAEALGIPWVYEVRGQLADTWAATRGPAARDSEKYALFQDRETEVMRDADLVVTLGEAMKANIVAAGIPAEKIIIAPNAVGGAFLEQPRRHRRGRAANSACPRTDSTSAPSAAWSAYEGLDDLVRAFALLAPEFPQLRLLIVGDGVAGPALQEQVRELGLADRAIFTGQGAPGSDPAVSSGAGRVRGAAQGPGRDPGGDPAQAGRGAGECTAGGWKRPARTSGDNRRRRQWASGPRRVTRRACTRDLDAAPGFEPTGIDGAARAGPQFWPRGPGLPTPRPWPRVTLGCTMNMRRSSSVRR